MSIRNRRIQATEAHAQNSSPFAWVTFTASALFLLILAAISPGFAGPAAADVLPPLGLDRDGREFALVSNSSWRVSRNGGGTFAPVRLVSLTRNANPGAVNASDRQQVGYIWAQSCTSAQQTLTFRRTYFLPGPAKTFGIDLYDPTSTGSPGNRNIGSVRIYFNGKLAVSAPGAYVRRPVAEGGPARLLRFGTNTVDVVIVKRAQNGDTGRCTWGAPPKPLGIFFSMQGEFVADMWLSRDAFTPVEHWQRAANLTRQFFLVGSAPLNKGPSGAYKGTLRLEISGDELIPNPQALKTTGEGLRNCKASQTSKQLVIVECEIFRFASGAKPRVSIPVIAKFAAGYDVATVKVIRTISASAVDLHPQTNGKSDYFYFCSAASTNPKCPPP